MIVPLNTPLTVPLVKGSTEKMEGGRFIDKLKKEMSNYGHSEKRSRLRRTTGLTEVDT